MVGSAWHRILRLLGRGSAREVHDEFAFHVAERVDQLVAGGMDPRAAREAAERAFGERTQSECIELASEREAVVRRLEWWDALQQDLQFALRQMAAHKTFTAAVVATLALGIGATTSLYSVVNAVLLRPLPYRDGDRIVTVWEQFRQFPTGSASPGHFRDWTEQSTVLEATTAEVTQGFNLTGTGDPERVGGGAVTTGYFDVLHMPPAAGRYFAANEAEARVVVLAYGFWKRRFAGDSAVIGKEIHLNGGAYTVIGVTPEGFTLSQFSEQLWVPLTISPSERDSHGSHFLQVTARLKPGVTLEAARRDLARVTDDIRKRFPDEMRERGVTVLSLYDTIVSSYSTQLWVLLGAVAFVLLIACGNVAGLLLARAMTRQKEFAIRGALGGGRGRIVRQLVTESLLLGCVGGGLGILLARAGVPALISLAPQGVPRLAQAGLQGDVLAFAIVSTVACAIIFGLAPALRATRGDLYSTLRESGRGSLAVVRDRLRSILVVGELAFALLLLVTAGLFVRSAQQVLNVSLGFNPAGVTAMRIALPPDRYKDPSAVVAGFDRVLADLAASPGVQAVGASTRMPLAGRSVDAGFSIEGRPLKEQSTGHVRLVSEHYFDALRIPVLQGRALTAGDFAPGAPSVVVINATMARQVFGKENPIGHRLTGWNPDTVTMIWREVVGVVGDVRAFGRENDTPPEIYFPWTQAPGGSWNAYQRAAYILVRTAEGANVGPTMRSAVARLDPLVPAQSLTPMDQIVSSAMATRRFNTFLLTLLGATGLILASVGIYGLMAFLIGQRTHEIGVRMVLGAQPGNVVRMLVRHGAILALAGIGIGGASAFWATRALRTMLFAIQPTDPMTWIAAALMLAFAAVVASLVPAWRATRVDLSRSISVG